MEKKLGRYLTKDEIPHHINGIRDDNRPKNLELFENNGKHLAKHNTKHGLCKNPKEYCKKHYRENKEIIKQQRRENLHKKNKERVTITLPKKLRRELDRIKKFPKWENNRSKVIKEALENLFKKNG